MVITVSELMERWNKKPKQAAPPWPLNSSGTDIVEGIIMQATVTTSDMLDLLAECLSFEAEQEWVPAAAGCQLCGGFPYSTKCDVSRQFGVCGCVVAAEMEQATEAEARQAQAAAFAHTVKEVLYGALPLSLSFPDIAEGLLAAQGRTPLVCPLPGVGGPNRKRA